MTQRHTPGPWIIDPNDALPLAVIEDTEDGQGVCSLDANRLPDGTYHPSVVQKARLIAAAPELLDALKSVLARRGGTMALGANDARSVAIRAAIAKAEGREI